VSRALPRRGSPSPRATTSGTTRRLAPRRRGSSGRPRLPSARRCITWGLTCRRLGLPLLWHRRLLLRSSVVRLHRFHRASRGLSAAPLRLGMAPRPGMLGRRVGIALPPVVGRGARAAPAPSPCFPIAAAASRDGRGDRPECSKAAASHLQPPSVVRGSSPGCVLLPPDLLPLQQELPTTPVRVDSVVVIPAVVVMLDGPGVDDGGGRGRRLSPASGRLLVHRRRRRSRRISTAGASAASVIHTSPRDAPTPPGAFSATSSVTARRTARS
jgi:hypothetical protein